jgi:hypothetical protein
MTGKTTNRNERLSIRKTQRGVFERLLIVLLASLEWPVG